MGQCGTAPLMGGRVSRHRKGHKTRKSRKVRGGAAYGFGEAITPGALAVKTVDTSAPMRPDGTAIADPFRTSSDTNAAVTGGKRRTRKAGKKSRKTKKAGRRHRKMRGGAGAYNAGSVRAEFVGNTGGTGPFTYGTYVGSPAKVGGYGPTFGADGVAKSS